MARKSLTYQKLLPQLKSWIHQILDITTPNNYLCVSQVYYKVVDHRSKIQGNRKSEMDLVTRRRYSYEPKLAYRCCLPPLGDGEGEDGVDADTAYGDCSKLHSTLVILNGTVTG